MVSIYDPDEPLLPVFEMLWAHANIQNESVPELLSTVHGLEYISVERYDSMGTFPL